MQRPVPSDRFVIAGFAGLLILMGALAVDSAVQVRNVSVTSAALRKKSRDRDALLDQLRTDTWRRGLLSRAAAKRPWVKTVIESRPGPMETKIRDKHQ